jgi:hypothetical protein
MIDVGALCELVKTYEKHGWVLRRILLSAASQKILTSESGTSLKGMKVVTSDVDAAWFSRPPQPGDTTWEIRYLGDIPYALLEKLDENDSEFEQQLAAVESRLRDGIAAKRKA